MPTSRLTPEIIEAAIGGFKAQKQHIDGQIAELRAMLNGGSSASNDSEARKPKRKVSAAALKRMREGQQRRWAKVRVEATPAASEPKPAKKKRKLSAAGRKAISEATKKRWAAKRAAAKKAA
jgi:hypothetical protein